MLGSTFGGNPTAIAAALATLDVIEEDGLLDRARLIGERIQERIGGMRDEFGAIGDVRGVGAMIGIEFVREGGLEPNPEAVAAIVAHARDHGLLLLPTGTHGNVIRLLPPLNLSDAELADGLELLEGAIRYALDAQVASA